MNRPPGRYKPDNSGLYRININGKYGFMDRFGKTDITPQFDAAYGFSEGLAAVRIGTKWGYIDKKGVVVITPLSYSSVFAAPPRQASHLFGAHDFESRETGA